MESITFTLILSSFFVAFIMLAIFLSYIIIKNNQREHSIILKAIANSIKPYFIKIDAETKQILELAINSWKVKRRLDDFYKKNDISADHRALDSGIDKLMEQINNFDIELVDFDGKKYNDGLNVEILNTIKEEGIKDITIRETMSPAILYRGQLIEKAKVTLLSGEE